MKKSQLYRVGVTLIPGVGPVLAKKLIAYCGGAEAVFKNKPAHLQKIPGIGPALSKAISTQKILSDAEYELRFVEKHQIKLDYYLDENYPYRLKRCEDAPVMLYSKGCFDWNSERVVSVVGTRKATDYGKRQCASLIEELADMGVLVVSGLAYGIDTVAHKSALQYGLPTLGVLAHGLDRIYPSANSSLAKKMCSNGGLVTEFLSKTNPDRENFVKRNRIVAGLSDATIVIESTKRGGALITADIANSYHRDVFAIPGRLGDASSEGCNHFIKTNRAALFSSAKDISYLLSWEKQLSPKQLPIFDLTPDEQRVVDAIAEAGELPIDQLSARLTLNIGQLSQILLQLELKQVVRVIPGKRYILK